MDKNYATSILLKEVDPETFLLGDFIELSLPDKSKQSSKNETKVPVHEMKSSKEREAAVLRDLLYVLTGKEGIYIKYSQEVDQSDIFSCLKGFSYRIHKDIDINFKEIAKQLSQLGKYYSALTCFEKFFNKASHGKVLSRLCEYIRNFLQEYQASVCSFFSLFDSDSNFSIISLYQKLNDISASSTLPSIARSMELLYDVVQLIVKENNKRLKNSNLLDMKFESIMKSLKEDTDTNILDDVFLDLQNSKQVKGGIILNIILSQLEQFNGNDRAYNLFHHIYEFVSTHYLQILNGWLQYGKIADPFFEFFIVESIPDSDSSFYNSYYWMNKYAIKREGLLRQFEPIEFQKQVFFTGKNLSIINECNCQHLIKESPFNPIKSLQAADLELVINEAYIRSNNLVYNLLCSGYQLSEFTLLLNKYFLLSDGSSFDNFLNDSNHELKRSYSSKASTDIIRSYDNAYITENKSKIEKLVSDLLEIKFENHSLLEDILDIIKTQVADASELLNASNLQKLTDLLKANLQNNSHSQSSARNSDLEGQRCNKLAISRLNLHLEIPFPLNQVILESQKLEYQILFRHSALLKFLEKRFEKSWRELGYQTLWTWTFEDKRVRRWIKRCRFIHTKMFDFLRIYSFYFKYDVIETNWSSIINFYDDIELGKRNFDLSSFKSQMTDFLSSSMGDLLLSQSDLACCLYDLFTLIIVFHEYVMSLRKALLLMDENLLNIYREKLNLSIRFNSVRKEEKLASLVKGIDSYHLTFQRKLTELCEYLGYYGEIDSPKLLLLHSKLVSSFTL